MEARGIVARNIKWDQNTEVFVVFLSSAETSGSDLDTLLPEKDQIILIGGLIPKSWAWNCRTYHTIERRPEGYNEFKTDASVIETLEQTCYPSEYLSDFLKISVIRGSIGN